MTEPTETNVQYIQRTREEARRKLYETALLDTPDCVTEAVANLCHAAMLEMARMSDDEVPAPRCLLAMNQAIANTAVSVMVSFCTSANIKSDLAKQKLYDDFTSTMMRLCNEMFVKNEQITVGRT